MAAVLTMGFSSCRAEPGETSSLPPTGSDGAAAGFGTAEGVHFTDYTLDSAFLPLWEKENSDEACAFQGIVVSTYFELKINGAAVPVYMARTARGPHSFAYVEVPDAGGESGFLLNVEVITNGERQNPVVLPESAGVTARADGESVTASIADYGSYTFTFDKGVSGDGSSLPLTLMVKAPETAQDEGYAVRTFEPGEYRQADLQLDEPQTLYYFKKGEYTIDCIDILADNVTVYFEPGTLLIAKALTSNEDGTPAAASIISAASRDNIKVIGHAALDLSFREAKTGTGVILNFSQVTNLQLAGLTVLNSCNWTCCFTNCESVEIRDLLLLGYRTYSDGVMVSDCTDVRVSGCFVRTGDDAMEVKSTSAGAVRTKNVVFENNAVWTDKGIAYGAVYESNFDQSEVTWRNNSIGYALADWSPHLGCVTVSMDGGDPAVQDHHMYFQNIEIYVAHCPVVTVMMHNGGHIHDIFFRSIKAKEVVLNEAVFDRCIRLVIANEDQGPLTDFVLKDLYFDDIEYNGTILTPENADDEIGRSFPDGYAFDWGNIRVNTLNESKPSL